MIGVVRSVLVIYFKVEPKGFPNRLMWDVMKNAVTIKWNEIEKWLGQSWLKPHRFSLHKAQKSYACLLIWFIVTLMFGFGNFIFYSLFWIICIVAIGWNTRCLSICQLWFYFLFVLQAKRPETFLCSIWAAVLCPIPLTISLVLQFGLSDIFVWSFEPVAYLE